jgi:catechol 2,3-dioxygenase-like lactoylglutathione lyase family enzyme
MVSAGAMMSGSRFAEHVEEAFAFLTESGFRLVVRTARQMRYETNRVFVTVEWDPRSGELNVFFGLQPTQGEPGGLALGDLLAMEGVDVSERRMPFQVADEAELRPFVRKLAEDMRNYAQPALSGDRMFYRRLKAFRDGRAQANMHEMKLRHVRSTVEEAWQQRDFAKVTELYASIEDDLTDAERAKLAYARTHQGG